MNYKTRQPFPNAAYVEGQRNFTYFDRSLTSGLTDVVIESPGDFLYIDQASTGAVSVELNMRQGGTLAPILLAAGGSIECDFASIKINAAAQLNKSVRIIIGNGAKIKGGANVNASSMSVSVVDGGLARTIAGQAFFTCAYCGAVAGQYSHLQLWNPSTSQKNLFVEKASASLPAAALVQLASYATKLATFSTDPLNKKVNGDNSVALPQIQTSATLLYTRTGPAYYCAANSTIEFNLTEPVLIPPGYGLNVLIQTANVGAFANFEYYEQ